MIPIYLSRSCTFGTKNMGLLTKINTAKDVMNIKNKVKDFVKAAFAELLSGLKNGGSNRPQEVKDACILSLQNDHIWISAKVKTK